MALCHSVTCLKERLIGDPLDIQMYQYVKTLASVDMKSNDLFSINFKDFQVLKRYDFESSLQRMSVVV
jgi:magnesium-transporting ATPase (P-type)